MSEYDMQAREFLQSATATITKELEGTRRYFPDDKEERDVYDINIVTPMGEYKFTFGDSIKNTERAVKSNPSDYAILSCLDAYNGTFVDFCADYGYSDDSIIARKIYNSVMRQALELKRIFTPEQLEKLGEIQ